MLRDIFNRLFSPIRVTVHTGYFAGQTTPHYFVNIANLSSKDVVVTGVWFDGDIAVLARQLPRRIKPADVFETCIETEQVKTTRTANVRLSTGRVIRSVYTAAPHPAGHFYFD